MQPITSYEGETELWYTISFDVGPHTGIEIKFKGVNSDDATDAFKAWLDRAEKIGPALWQSAMVRFNGAERRFTFRADWVSSFTINPKGGSLRA